MTPLLVATAIGAALVAGIFYAFSTFVMAALGRLAPGAGIAAMQSINIVVVNPLFFLAFFGAGALCLATLGVALVTDAEVSVGLVLAGSVLYLVGCLGVTVAGNVPLNERLARVDPDDPASESAWRRYLHRWSLFNHIRTAASLAAAVLFAVAAT